jgi:DNA-binding FadR family transcriptional regulator
VQDLGRRIVRGDFKPGEVLDLAELEREFQSSRPAIREALRVLTAKGLVDARPKRGTFVRPLNEWSLLDADLLRWRVEALPDDAFLVDLAELRGIVEPAAARLAAARRSEEHLEIMTAAVAVMHRGTRIGDQDAVDADLIFHRTLLAAAGNALLGQMGFVIEAGLRVRDALVHAHAGWNDASAWHQYVLDAVVSENPDRAESAMHDLLAVAARDVATLGLVKPARGTRKPKRDPASVRRTPPSRN